MTEQEEVGYGYPPIENNDNFMFDLMSRVEFAHLADVKPYTLSLLETSAIDERMKETGTILIQGHQAFVKSFMNPTSPYDILLLKYSTGSGKTIACIVIAIPFLVRTYVSFETGKTTYPRVNIVGFSKGVFINELLRYPVFGFITPEQKDEVERLRELSRLSQANYDAYIQYRKKLKRGISRYFAFFGYKEFANKVLNSTEKERTEFFKRFENSLFICDEIHEVYNSIETNNYGKALLEVRHKIPGVRMVLATATVATNNPTEALDLLKLMNTTYGKEFEIDKSEYFDGDDLRPAALHKIALLADGKVSFVEDLDPTVYPERIIQGEAIASIDYLKFIRCPMVKLHWNAYKQAQADWAKGTEESEQETEELAEDKEKAPETIGQEIDELIEGVENKEETETRPESAGADSGASSGNTPETKPKSKPTARPRSRPATEDVPIEELVGDHDHIPYDGHILVDMVVPVPDIDNSRAMHPSYRIKEIKHMLPQASAEWRQEYGADYIDKIITGDFLSEANIFDYSGKYKQLLFDCLQINARDDGKIFIFHQYVYGSGVTLIAEMLRANGFIDETTIPTATTICSHCGKKMEGHSEVHKFNAARFLLVHSDMDPMLRENKIFMFNSPNNTWGTEYKILIGSRVISAREDLKAVRHQFVLSLPFNIPTLIQVLGRTVRRNSHALLPPDKRQTYVYILTSCYPGDAESGTRLSYEEDRYSIKMKVYKTIQYIERIFNQVALDAHLYKRQMAENQLTSLPFVPVPMTHDGQIVKFTPGTGIDESKLIAYRALYTRDEIHYVKYALRRIFNERSRVFTMEDLIEEVRNVKFFMPINPKMILEESIKMAIHEMTYNRSQVQFRAGSFVNNLLSDDVIVKTLDGSDNVIMKIGKYYVLTLLYRPAAYTHTTNYGVPHKLYSGFPILDIDSWQRITDVPVNLKVNINTLKIPYDIQRREFFLRYNHVEPKLLLESINDFTLDFHEQFIREIISYIFGLLRSTEAFRPSEYHDFYLRMVYIYDKFGMMVFASYLRDSPLYDNYSAYYAERTSKTRGKDDEEAAIVSIKHHSNFLSRQSKKHRIKTIKLRIERFNGAVEKQIKGKKKGILQVPDNYLPVGYLMKSLMLYNPEAVTWQSYSSNIGFEPRYSVENDIIVGFYEQSKTYLNIKFKLRSPKQFLAKFEDARKNERGTYCNSYTRKDLLRIAHKLDLQTESAKIESICSQIRKELIRRELEGRRKYWAMTDDERKKHPMVRWFYMHFEEEGGAA